MSTTIATPDSPTAAASFARFLLPAWLLLGLITAFFASDFDAAAIVVFGLVWTIGVGILGWRFFASLIGPVLVFDAIKTGRKKRNFFLRVAYAIALGVIFTMIYTSWSALAIRMGGGTIRPKDLAQLAESFFSTFMVIQFILVCVLTPASTAGAIAEEKERRTLEFLLATDLRDREILFGKLATRVGGLGLLLIAGLPVLGMIQFFGGIDPEMVFAGFAATLALMLSLAALSIASSVISRKARDAIALTYLAAVAYCLLSGILHALAMSPLGRDDSVNIFGYDITWQDLTYPFVAGNPFYMVPETLFSRRMAAGGSTLFRALGHFLLFHAVAIAVLVTWSGLRLRSIALVQAFGGGRTIRRAMRKQRASEQRTNPSPTTQSKASTRPEVGSAPIIWKEVFVDSGLRLGILGQIIVYLLIIGSFSPVFIVVVTCLFDQWGSRFNGPWWASERWHEVAQGMNIYARSVGSIVGSLIFLAVAVRGAGCISGERDKHSLDVLLTTPLDATTIIWGKWWGCMLGMRWAWAWLFSIWVISATLGGIHPVFLVALIVSTIVYASAFAWIGVFFSVVMRTTLRSTMASICLSLFLGGGYFLVFAFCCMMPLSFLARGDAIGRDAMGIVVDFFCGFSPSVNLGWLPIHEIRERDLTLSGRDIPYLPFWIIGMIGWGALSVGLANATINRFKAMANRLPFTPERSPRTPPPLPLQKPRASDRDDPVDAA